MRINLFALFASTFLFSASANAAPLTMNELDPPDIEIVNDATLRKNPGGKLILEVDFEENPIKEGPLPLHLDKLDRTRYRILVKEELPLEYLRSYGELDIFRCRG